MSRISNYLNFTGNTEQAFEFYKSVFGVEYTANGIARYGDLPNNEESVQYSEEQKNMILHVEIEIFKGYILMGTDAPESMGNHIIFGNNNYINIEPDTKSETRALFSKLSENGNIVHPLEDMYWGALYGACVDQFGVRWMFNCIEKE